MLGLRGKLVTIQEGEMSHYEAVRLGGLMRCCLATLEEKRTADPKYAEEGATLKCDYCSDGEMIFNNGAWEWNNRNY